MKPRYTDRQLEALRHHRPDEWKEAYDGSNAGGMTYKKIVAEKLLKERSLDPEALARDEVKMLLANQFLLTEEGLRAIGFEDGRAGHPPTEGLRNHEIYHKNYVRGAEIRVRILSAPPRPVIFRKTGEKGKYSFADARCLGAGCWQPGEFHSRGATGPSGSRNTGNSDLTCLYRAYHGCPDEPGRAYDVDRAALRKKEGWKKV